MFTLISTLITIAGLIAWGISRQKKRDQALLAKFREHNQSQGTSFPEDNIDSELILRDNEKRCVVAFDPQSRKICMVMNRKDAGHVVDFSYIRQWQLKWTETSGNGGIGFKNVHFDFSTTDLKQPLIRVPVIGKAYGDTWNSRLGILLGS